VVRGQKRGLSVARPAAALALALDLCAVFSPGSAWADPSAGNQDLMLGARGAYPITREASGTSWQPDSSVHGGLHLMSGEWMLMGHALANGVYDWQEGPRGDDRTFVAGMLMGTARRAIGGGDTLQLRAMLSPDPLMGKQGLPLLLATGETADGHTPLVDRQHPHDLFMELSASYSRRVGESGSAFVYAGLPGEPAFGPPAFMHRLSIMDSPEPPISHHWLDSTHIAFGVATLGWVQGDWKLEFSRFRGREPDQFRYNIETGPLDSSAARLSWNATRDWSLQVSWAAVTSPEQLEPGMDRKKRSASAIHTRRLGDQGVWSSTFAWGRRSSAEGWLDAYAVESAVRWRGTWTTFMRAERVDNDELAWSGGPHGPAYTVGKASIGVIRDFSAGPALKLGIGALYARNFLPAALAPQYGGSMPQGAMAFIRLKVE
jgi:hypothetical protein